MSVPPGAPARRERIGYALGDTASNLYWKVFEFFVVIYYTDVLGLGAGAVGTMLLVTRVLDAGADPLMGLLADRTSTRSGKFRPYLVWFSVPLAAAGVLAFSAPATLGAGARLGYAYATYAALMLCYTAINIPYSALLGVITASSAERTRLSAARFIGAFVGALFVQKATLDLVRLLGRGNAARGWTWTMAAYGAAAVVLFSVCFALTRERVLPPRAQSNDVRADLRALRGDRPFAVLFALAALIIVAFWLRGSGAAYYFKYYLRREGALGWFLASGGLAGVAGVAATGFLTRRADKRSLYRALMTGAGALMLVQALLPPNAVVGAFALNVAVSLLLGPIAPLIWAMFGDVADHVEWKTGRRATGLVFAGCLFAMKLGAAVGGWSLGALLDAVGYRANVAQTPAALQGIVVAFTAVPGAICLAAALTAARYGLDDTAVGAVEKALAARRAAAADPPASG
jgi:GPH family glycoside/pentoside/hexuronide:cation symporter